MGSGFTNIILSSRTERSVVKDLGDTHLLLRYVTEILPPFGRLDDKY